MLLNFRKTCSCFFGRARSSTSAKAKAHSSKKTETKLSLALGASTGDISVDPKGSTPSSDVTQVLAPTSNVRLWPF